jgi:hypothetical protein
MTIKLGGPGELSRSVCHEANDDYPSLIEIVAYFGVGRKGKRRSIEISADEFFGRGAYGAPVTGDRLIGMVEKLRKGKS